MLTGAFLFLPLGGLSLLLCLLQLKVTWLPLMLCHFSLPGMLPPLYWMLHTWLPFDVYLPQIPMFLFCLLFRLISSLGHYWTWIPPHIVRVSTPIRNARWSDDPPSFTESIPTQIKGNKARDQNIKSIGVPEDRSHDGIGHWPCFSRMASTSPASSVWEKSRYPIILCQSVLPIRFVCIYA